jgi:hypothetical protein
MPYFFTGPRTHSGMLEAAIQKEFCGQGRRRLHTSFLSEQFL